LLSLLLICFSDRSHLIAVVVPEPAQLQALVASTPSLNLPVQTPLAELCRNPKVAELVLKDLNQLARQASLKGFEIVRQVYLHPEEFSVHNNLLTPTFKLRRSELVKFFRSQIDQLYATPFADAN
jgi:long-chain acyl-CoA synthetase